MFDKMYLVPQARSMSHNVSVRVEEKRAPTDDSIRLAKEYEERIWRDVSARIVAGIPSIDVKYVVADKTPHDRSTHIFFKINGHPIRVRIDDYADKTRHMREVAEQITQAVLVQLMKGM